MNVINKMVIIPEKEYHLIKRSSNNTDTEEEKPKSIEMEKKKSDPEIKLNEYKESFRKAIRKYEKKLSKRPKKDKKIEKCQTLKWTNVKNF